MDVLPLVKAKVKGDASNSDESDEDIEHALRADLDPQSIAERDRLIRGIIAKMADMHFPPQCQVLTRAMMKHWNAKYLKKTDKWIGSCGQQMQDQEGWKEGLTGRGCSEEREAAAQAILAERRGSGTALMSGA